MTMRHDRIDPAGEGPAVPWPEPPILVGDRMTQPVVTIARTATVETAWKTMKARKIRHLPVVDADGRLVGIVTDRDLRQVVFDPALHERLADLADTLGRLTVDRVMTSAAISVRPGTEIREAARLMHERKIGALPVVEGDRVVGILTETDVLRTFVEVLGERALPRAVRWAWPAASPPGRTGRAEERAAG